MLGGIRRQSTTGACVAQNIGPWKGRWSLAGEETLANDVEHLAAVLGRLAKASLVRLPPLPLFNAHLSSRYACTSSI